MLDLRRARKDKSYPIIYRLVVDSNSTTIPTGKSVLKTNWNTKSLTVKKDCETIPNSESFNAAIAKKVNELRGTLAELEQNGKIVDLTISELKNRLIKKSKSKRVTFVEYIELTIASMKKDGALRNAQIYQSALNFLTRSSKHTNLPFPLFNVQLLERMEKVYMNEEGRHYNGLSVHLRSLRAIYNKAISEGVVSVNSYPFRRSAHDKDMYVIKNEKTTKRAVSKEVIVAIEKYTELTTNDIEKKYLYYFLFSFYLRGMNIGDMAKLKASNIINNDLVYRRSKTKRSFEVRINEKARNILNYFDLDEKRPTDYIFPIIKQTTTEGSLKDIKYCTKTTNKYLKETATDLKIEAKITTYVSRHSWATIADKAGVDRRIISKGLGHADLQTTNIYIDDIVSNDDLAVADDIITG